MNEEEYEELARWLSCHPGRWVAWPEPFGTRAEADALFESLRDGGLESFKVDSAALRLFRTRQRAAGPFRAGHRPSTAWPILYCRSRTLPWLPFGLHAVSVLGGLTAAVTLTAADIRNDIRRIGRNIEASERSERK